MSVWGRVRDWLYLAGVVLVVGILVVVFDLPCIVASAVSRGRVCNYEEVERMLYPWDYDN
jgi:hypothetical protein